LGITLASTTAGVNGLVTGTSSQWMESSYTLIDASIPLDAAKLQAYLAQGNTEITIRIYNPTTVSSGGEIDIAAKEAEDGTYNGTGAAGTVVRSDLVGKGPKLEVTGELSSAAVSLQDLTIDGTTVSGFSPYKKDYRIEMSTDATTYPSIAISPADAGATVSAITYSPTTFNPAADNQAAFTVSKGAESADYTLTFFIDPTAIVMDTILKRIQAYNESTYNVATLASAVTTYLAVMDATGRFTDIDYSDTEGRQYDWKPLVHIDRLRDMAFAYTMPGSAYFESDALYDKIVLALQSWETNQPPACNNWWFPDLPVPQRLGIMFIQMRKGKQQIPATLEAQVIANRMKPGWNRGSGYFTGANKVDYCTHWVYSALLKRDGALLTTAVDGVFSPLTFTTGEGLQYDYSYFQHGNQLYIGGYGDELIKGSTLIASYVAGTEYELTGTPLTLLSDFMRKTWLPSIRGQYLSWNVTGRGMSRQPSQLNKNGASIYAERMISIDSEHAAEYAAAVQRMRGEQAADYNVAAQSTHFFKGDYTLHVRPNYSANVRLLSSRTETIEFGNNENLKNFYLSDGSMDIATHGNEYDGIFAVWNWTRIPGVTSPQKPFTPASLPAGYSPSSDGSSNPYTPHGTNMGGTGTSTFAGGVSDSVYTVTAYSQTMATNGAGDGKTGVGAKKGWFFFEDEIVCLGAGINSDVSVNSYDIFTTVNQCNLNGDVTVSANGAATTLPANTETTYTSPAWVFHDNIAYLFPQGGNVGVGNTTQSGNWYDINMSAPDATVSRGVFSLYVNHGKAVSNGSYAYIILPNPSTTAAVETYQATNGVEILANTDSVQVVRNNLLGVTAMIFYKATTFEHSDLSVKTNKACALIFKRDNNDLNMHIADPAQSQTNITVSVKTANMSDWTSVVCTFTGTGNYAGAGKKYVIPDTYTSLPTLTNQPDRIVRQEFFNLMGQQIRQPQDGLYILRNTYRSGKTMAEKVRSIAN